MSEVEVTKLTNYAVLRQPTAVAKLTSYAALRQPTAVAKLCAYAVLVPDPCAESRQELQAELNRTRTELAEMKRVIAKVAAKAKAKAR